VSTSGGTSGGSSTPATNGVFSILQASNGTWPNITTAFAGAAPLATQVVYFIGYPGNSVAPTIAVGFRAGIDRYFPQ
jgi:hypothetical protein